MITYLISAGCIVVGCVMLACIRCLFEPCLHLRVRWPMHGEQECLDCFARRSYKFGERPGPWKKP